MIVVRSMSEPLIGRIEHSHSADALAAPVDPRGVP
jgi:hypothetical protein